MCTNRDSLLEIFLYLIELILKIIVVEAVERKLTLTSINEVFFPTGLMGVLQATG